MSNFNFKFKTFVITLMGVFFFSVGNAYASSGSVYSRGRAFLRPECPSGAGKVYVGKTATDEPMDVPAASEFKACNSSTTAAMSVKEKGAKKETWYHFFAQPNSGYKFTGWYNPDGSLATKDTYYKSSITSGTQAISGDVYANLDAYAGFIKVIQMSFVRPENGAFTIKNNGATVADYASFTVDGAVKLTASPEEGYKLRGWYTTTDGGVTKTYVAFGLNYEPKSFTSDVTIGAEFALDDGQANYWVKGTNYLETDLASANTKAAVSASKTIVVVSDGVVPAGNYTISSGVTLLIPYAEEYSLMTSPRVLKTGGASGATSANMKTTTFRKLTLADGATIDCRGNICIGGTLASVSGGNCSSFPTGAVGMLDMSKGGTINLKSGANLYAWGYVKGQDMDEGNNTTGCGQINAESGSHVWEFYQVGDWRGGTHSSTLYSNKSWKFFPFQAWTIQNVEVPVTYQDGATGECYWSIFGNGEINTITFTAIANSDAVFKIGSGSTVKKWYDPTTDRVCVEFDKTSTVDAISLDVLGETITSKDFNLPLPANMKLIFKSGATSTIENPIVAHAGSIIEVQAGGTLTLSNSLYLFDQEEWDVYCMKGYYFRTYYSPSIHFKRGAGTSKANLDDATLIVDGQVTVSGSLYATAHGANVTGHHNGTLQYTKLATNTTMVQCTDFSTNANVPVRLANMHNENDSYTRGSVATYKNVNGRWFLSSKSTPKSNKTYDFSYIKSGDVYGTGGTNATVSACYSKDMTGSELRDKWANIRAADCDDWWDGIEDGNKYNYFEENAWHQFIKTTTTVGEDDEAMDVYSGTNGKLYAMNEDCDIEEIDDIDANCQYTIDGVKKALIGDEFISVVKNSDDEAYHKSDAATTYYICFPGCVWKPATKIAETSKAYTVEDVPYIWYSGAWLAVTWDSTLELYYTFNASGQKVYYEYASSAWGLATPVAEVITAAGTEYVYKFTDAVTKAQEGGANVTIRLLKNVTISQFKYAGANNCTLDLNGFRITSSTSSVIYVNSSNSKVIITDQSTAKTGEVYVKFNRSNNIITGCYVAYGSLVINGGTFHFENTNDPDDAANLKGVYGVNMDSNTSFVMNGGKIEAVSKGTTLGVYVKNSTVRINGGEIFAQTNYTSGAKQSEVIGIGSGAANAIVYVNGGTITSESTVNPASDSPVYVYGIKMPNSNAKLYMNGGTVEAKARKYACGIQVGASGVTGMTAILSGGTVKSDARSTLQGIGVISYANTTLSGVRIEATALMDIAYGVWVKSGTTTINEGTYSTSSAHSDVAGLRLAGGNLIVNGGEIYTEANNSNYARGIYADAGTLTVNDGTFEAKAKTTYAYGIYVPSTKTPSCTVNNGKFMVTSVGGSSNVYAVKGPSGTITLAGAYYNLEPEATYVADGMAVRDVDPIAEKPIYDEGYRYTIAGTEYTITWKNCDGTELGQTIVPVSIVPVWEGDAPTYGTTSTTYEFDGWCTEPNNGGTHYDGDLPAADADVTYYAHYKTVVAEVTVSGVTTRYYTGASAWAAINAAGCQEATLRLLSDIEDMTQMVYAPAEDKAMVTVDLNGHHWTMSSEEQSPMLEVNKADAKLIIADNSASHDGYLLNEWEKTDATLVCAQVTAGELAIENGGLRAHNTASTQKAEAVYVATGGRFTATGGALHAEASNGATTIESAGKTYIDAGTITASHSAADDNREGLRVLPGAEVYITGGTFNLEDKGYAVHCFGGTTAISGTPSFIANYGLAVDECLGEAQGSTELTAHATIAGGIFTTTGWTLSAKTATEAGYTLHGDVRVTDGKFHTDVEVVDNTSAVGQLQLLGGYYTNNSNSHLADYKGTHSAVTDLPADQPEYGEGYRFHITSVFTVTWVIDGVSPTEAEYGYNAIPDYGSTPVHPGTDTYEFIGWSPAIAPVTEDVTYTAVFVKYEAEIVETGERYEHFADAWKDAQNMPTATLRVLSDVSHSTQMVLTPDSASGAQLMTFDLNNHKIEYTGNLQAGFLQNKVGTTLKIVDNSVDGEGVLWHEGDVYDNTVFSVIQVRHGTAILESGKLYAKNNYNGSTLRPSYAVYVNQSTSNTTNLGATFYMTGGVAESHSRYQARGIYTNGPTAEAYISGGEVIARTDVEGWGAEASGLYVIGNSKMYVSGTVEVTAEANTYPMGIYLSGVNAQCTIEGGTITSISQDAGARGIWAYSGNLNITGGTFNANAADASKGEVEVVRVYKAIVNISGGEFNSSVGVNWCLGVQAVGPSTTTISGNPVFNVQRGIRAGYLYHKTSSSNADGDAVVIVNGGTFNTSAYAIGASSIKEKYHNTYTLTGKITVNDGRFFAEGSTIVTTSGSGSILLKGGYYNETDGTTHLGQILAKKDGSTDPDNAGWTFDEKFYQYKLTTSYNVTWKMGETTDVVSGVAGGTIPTHADPTTYTGTDGKTYFFTGWMPTPAPIYEDAMYEATGVAYEAKLKIGSGEWVNYAHFLDAWDDLLTAEESAEATIALLNNVTLTEPLTYAPLIDDARSVLDLNNYTLSVSGESTRALTVSKADAKLTVTDNSLGKGGKLSHVRTSAEAIQTVWVASGELIVDGGTVYAKNEQNDANWHPATAVYVAQSANAKLTFHDGTIAADAKYHAYPVYNYGTVVMDGGALVANATSAGAVGIQTLGGSAIVSGSAAVRVDAPSNATGVSTSGFISNDGKTRKNGTTIITGGDIQVSVASGTGIGLQANATGRQVSGTVHTAQGIITVSGGNVHVTGSNTDVSSLQGIYTSRWILTNNNTPHAIIGEATGECAVSGGTFLVEARDEYDHIVGDADIEAVRVYGNAIITGGDFTVNAANAYGLRIFKGIGAVDGTAVVKVNGVTIARGIALAEEAEATQCDATMANNTATVAVSGGTFNVTATGASSAADAIMVWASTTTKGYAMEGHATIEGGVFNVTSPYQLRSIAIRSPRVASGSDLTQTATPQARITGGKFNLNKTASAEGSYADNIAGGATSEQVDLEGGFYNLSSTLSQFTKGSYYCRELASDEDEYDEGYRYTISEATNIKVTVDATDTYFATLNQAFEYAKTQVNPVITLMENSELTERYTLVPTIANWRCTLDLNNYTLTGATTFDRFLVLNKADMKLTITDKSVDKGGEFNLTTAYAGSLYGIVLTNGELEFAGGVLHVENTTAGQPVCGVKVDGASARFTQTGGTLEVNHDANGAAEGIAVGGAAAFTGGEVVVTSTGTTACVFGMETGGALTISGGKFNGGTQIIANAGTGTATITGGYYSNNETGLSGLLVSPYTLLATTDADKATVGAAYNWKVQEQFRIRFYDGFELLQESYVAKDEMPVYTGSFRPNTETYIYTFTGWSPAIKAADDHQDYYATYSSASTIASVTVDEEITYYASVAEALAFAELHDGALITVLKANTIGALTYAPEMANHHCTLDLNGKVVNLGGGTTYLFTVNKEDATLTITDSSDEHTGQLRYRSTSINTSRNGVYVQAGNLIVDGAAIAILCESTGTSAQARAINAAAGTSVTLRGDAQLTATSRQLAYGIYTYSSAGVSVTLEGGSINATTTGSSSAVGVRMDGTVANPAVLSIPETSTINITATSQTETAYAIYYGGYSRGTIAGGTFTSSTKTGNGAYGVYAQENEHSTISGGSFTVRAGTESNAQYAWGVRCARGTIDITGGTFTVHAADQCAGVYAYAPTSVKAQGAGEPYGGTINVSGGTFNVTATTSAWGVFANKWGSTADNYANAGTVNVSGGTFTVESTNARGIIISSAATYGSATGTPCATVTGGKFNVSGSGAYATSTSATETAEVIEGGYYSINTGLDAYVAPTKAGSAYYCINTLPEEKAVVGDEYEYKVTSQFRIRFLNYDGTVLQTLDAVNSGETPTYTEATPVKPNDADNIYTFDSWTPALAAATDNQDYTATYSSVPAVASVKVDEDITYYASVAEALDYAELHDGALITVLQATSIPVLTYAPEMANHHCTLDLNGKTVTLGANASHLFVINKADATFTITDGSDGHTGIMKRNDALGNASRNAIRVQAGNLVMDGGEIELVNTSATGSSIQVRAIYADANTSVTLRGNAKLTTEARCVAYGIYANGAGASVTLEGGTITATANNTNSAYGVRINGTVGNPAILNVPETSTLELTATAQTTAAYAIYGGHSSCTIEGGTFTSITKTGNGAYGILGEDNNHSTISGGDFTVIAGQETPAQYAWGVRCARGTIDITGGTFDVSGGNTCAGIYAFVPFDSEIRAQDDGPQFGGTVNVYGGEFTVTTTSSAYGVFVSKNGIAADNLGYAGTANIYGGTFIVTSTNARGMNVNSATKYGTATATPQGTITGGKFIVTGTGAQATNEAATTTNFVIDGGYYSNNAGLSKYCVAPKIPIQMSDAECTAVGMPANSYKVAVLPNVPVDITDWMSSSLTINVTGWEFSGWPYTVNGVEYLEDVNLGPDYTLTIPYTGEAGDEITIKVVNKDGEVVSQHTYVVPMNITTPTILTENPSVDIYVHTTELTIDADITAKNIYVSTNARLVINSGKTLTADSLFLRTDIEQAAELENYGTIAGSTKVYYTRIISSNSTYYQFGLPCSVSVPVKDIRLANGKDSKYGGGSGWILRYYDESMRAENGKGSNWVTLDKNDFITGGVGYEMFSAMNYYREFYFPVEIPSPQPTSVPVTYTDGAAGYLDCGWNVLVTPFTHRYDNAQYPEAPVICWMTPNGFEQDIPEIIWPARVFAYQTAKSGSLTFDTQMIVAAPRRVKAVDEETRIQWIRLDIEDANGVGDQTSVYSHPTRYDQTYQTGIDVAKQTITSTHAIIYSLQPYGEMAFAGVADDVLKEGVALTVYSPSAEELTISMRDNDWLNRLEKVYLVDNETGLLTDLLMQDYRFDAEAGTTEGRFVLQGVFKAPQGTTDIEPTSDSSQKGREVEKLVIHDKLYIRVNGTLYDVTGKQVK